MDTSQQFFCDGNGGLTSRRVLLSAGLAAGLSLFAARPGFAQASFRKGSKDGPILVSLFLRGGADCLNIVPPVGDDNYHRARPSLGLKASGAKGDRALDLDGYFGLHPALVGLHELFHEGKAAFVQAVGSGDETRSHFEAMGTMERGMFENGHGTNNGWLARHIAATPERVAPLRAISFSSTLPDSLGGALGAIAVNELNSYKLRSAPDAALSVLEDMHRGTDAMSVAGSRTLSVLKNLRRSDPAKYQPDHGTEYPTSPLGQAMRDVAYLVKQDVGLEVACLESGNWDTHVAQGAGTGWQALLLKDLNDCISAFYKDLGKESTRVVLTVQTEFGRRLEENSGFGTDHGHGGMMMVFGGSVVGGKVHRKWPGLAKENLVGPGDLAVTTDYRNVLADVLEGHLRTKDVQSVFPNLKREAVGILA